jgi:hypothetical protein
MARRSARRGGSESKSERRDEERREKRGRLHPGCRMTDRPSPCGGRRIHRSPPPALLFHVPFRFPRRLSSSRITEDRANRPAAAKRPVLPKQGCVPDGHQDKRQSALCIASRHPTLRVGKGIAGRSSVPLSACLRRRRAIASPELLLNSRFMGSTTARRTAIDESRIVPTRVGMSTNPTKTFFHAMKGLRRGLPVPCDCAQSCAARAVIMCSAGMSRGCMRAACMGGG